MIDTVHLNFNLNEDVTHVHSKLQLKPNYTPNGAAPALTLNGRPDVKLVEIKLAGPSQQLLDSKQASSRFTACCSCSMGRQGSCSSSCCTGSIVHAAQSKAWSPWRGTSAPGLCRQSCNSQQWCV